MSQPESSARWWRKIFNTGNKFIFFSLLQKLYTLLQVFQELGDIEPTFENTCETSFRNTMGMQTGESQSYKI
jgi:hypothetical protein